MQGPCVGEPRAADGARGDAHPDPLPGPARRCHGRARRQGGCCAVRPLCAHEIDMCFTGNLPSVSMLLAYIVAVHTLAATIIVQLSRKEQVSKATFVILCPCRWAPRSLRRPQACRRCPGAAPASASTTPPATASSRYAEPNSRQYANGCSTCCSCSSLSVVRSLC